MHASRLKTIPRIALAAVALVAVAVLGLPHASSRLATANDQETQTAHSLPAAATPRSFDGGDAEVGRNTPVEDDGPIFEAPSVRVSAGPGLNETERAKLDLARAAMELAEASAGDPPVDMSRSETRARLSLEEADAMKLDRLRSRDGQRPSLIETLRGETEEVAR